MSGSRDREVKPKRFTAETSTQDLFRLDERTILVTGGGGAMGLEATTSILESGGDVVCVDQQEEPLPDLWAKVQRLAEQHKSQVWYYTCDVTNVDDIRMTLEKATSKTRYPLRGLVTCAGICGGGPAVDFSIDKIRRILDVNFVGTFVCAQAAAKEMIKQNVTGSMVLIASMSAHGSNKVCLHVKGSDLIPTCKSADALLSRALTPQPTTHLNPLCFSSHARWPQNGAVELELQQFESTRSVLDTSKRA